jgi:hypothetical protein
VFFPSGCEVHLIVAGPGSPYFDGHGLRSIASKSASARGGPANRAEYGIRARDCQS